MEGPGERNLKGYQLIEQVSSGRFGSVYRAHQAALGRDVAIKVVPAEFASRPSFIRRFEGEAETVARLEHLFIVPIYDYWRDPDGAYVVARWMRGGSVGDSIQTKGACTPQRAASIINQLALALAVAHNNGIIHGNIKPSNILLDEDGNGYLSDFGLFRNLARLEGIPASAFVANEWLDYLAPEQIRHEPVTPQTDLYSLGVTLYEMITGQHPFAGCSDVERMYRHMNDPLPAIGPLTQQPAGDINQIIQFATAKDPANRYGHVLAFAEALQGAVMDEDGAGLELLQALTRRELDVLQLLTEGMSNQEIADKLVISLSTVKWYNQQLYDKLQVSSRTQAALRARQLKLFGAWEMTSVSEVATGEISPVLYWPEPENPYKGLRAFGAADRQDFFGREKLIEELLQKMKPQEPLSRFLAIIGPSGSGKSSLVRAGLLPAVWAGRLPGSECWFTVEMLPGTHALEALEIGLTKVAARHASRLHEHLGRDERGLVRAAELILPDDDSRLLLVVDQFEELFTLVAEEEHRQHFLDLLTTAVGDMHSRVSVVITLRADYYDRPLRYPQFGDLLRKRMVTILPLSAKEMERAICGPAERVGVTFDAGLVAQIVSEMSYQPGALPLLQYALTELFEQREGRRLTAAAYQQFDGAVGALAHRADALLAALDERSREMARQMFLRLVALGEGTGDTRRRVAMVELRALGEDADLMDEIIDYFARHRLLALDHEPTSRQPTVELAHEALIREWQRLCRWLDVSRADIRMQRLLARAASEWRAAGADPSFLLRDARLAQFEGWTKSTELSLTGDEQRYLDASLRLRLKQEAAEAERQMREAALERRAVRHLRALVAVLAAAAIVATALSLFALDRSRRFQREAAVNHSLVLARGAEQALGSGYVDRALALALAAVDMADPPPEAVRVLSSVAFAPGTRAVLVGHSAAVRSVAVSADGRQALSGSCAEPGEEESCTAGEIILWDLETGREVRRFTAHDGWVNAVAFSPNGSSAVSASEDGTMIVWNPSTWEQVRQLAGHDGGITSVAFGPDDTNLLCASTDATLILWDLTTDEAVRRFKGHGAAVNRVRLSRDGLSAFSASDDNLIIQWNVASGEEIRRFAGHDNRITDVAVDPRGETILSAGMDLSLRRWEVATGEQTLVWRGVAPLTSVAITPDGNSALFSPQQQLLILDLASRLESGRLLGHTLPDSAAGINEIVVSPDGRLVLSAADDGTARVWQLPGERSFAGEMGIVAVAISPDGRELLVGAEGAGIWDVSTGRLIRRLAGLEGSITPGGIAFSLDGRYAAATGTGIYSGGDVGTVMLWEARFGSVRCRLEGHNEGPRALAFSPDGRTLLSGSQNFMKAETDSSGDLILWDVSSCHLLRRFETTEDASSIAFSADGRRALVSAAYYQNVTLWDVARGQPLQRYSMPESITLSVIFGPEETTFVAGLLGGNLPEVDLETGEVLRSFTGHTGNVWSVDLGPDGRYLVSGSDAGEVILWDYASGQEISRFTGSPTMVQSVTFSPDGESVFFGSPDGVLYQWQLTDATATLEEVQQWVAANRYVPELTCEERAEYRVEPLCTAGTR